MFLRKMSSDKFQHSSCCYSSGFSTFFQVSKYSILEASIQVDFVYTAHAINFFPWHCVHFKEKDRATAVQFAPKFYFPMKGDSISCLHSQRPFWFHLWAYYKITGCCICFLFPFMHLLNYSAAFLAVHPTWCEKAYLTTPPAGLQLNCGMMPTV